MNRNRLLTALRLGAAAALLCGALAGGALAQSPWSDLARKIAVQPTQRARQVTGQVTEYDRSAPQMTAQAAPAAQDPEAAYAERLHPPSVPPVPTPPTPQVAAIDNSQSGVGSIVGAITGLATGNSKSGDKIDLGKESDDTHSLLASNLFKNPDIRRLLGDQPRFVYNPGDKPDPMLVPWVRRAAIFNELMNEADADLAKGKVDDAMKAYQRIVDLHDSRFTPVVQAKVDAINAQRLAESQKTLNVQQVALAKIELPAWVQENTTGVVLTSDNPICLVGDYMLHRGETIPAYPEVKVVAIDSKSVTYQVQDKKFEVTFNTIEDSTGPAGRPGSAPNTRPGPPRPAGGAAPRNK